MRTFDHLTCLQVKFKNWTEVFTIEPFVVHHFRRTGKEWVLDVCSKALRNPKKAHSEWLLQFGEAVAQLGREKARELGKNLYYEVMKSGLFEENRDARDLLKDYEKRMLLLYMRPHQKEIKNKIRISREKVEGLGLRANRLALDF